VINVDPSALLQCYFEAHIEQYFPVRTLGIFCFLVSNSKGTDIDMSFIIPFAEDAYQVYAVRIYGLVVFAITSEPDCGPPAPPPSKNIYRKPFPKG
jgi:hypothetical protein